MNFLYALHDQGKSTMFLVSEEEARQLNKIGYGIHSNVQIFRGTVRRKSELIAIRSFAIDLDNKEHNKESLLKSIKKSPIEPSKINETKNGFHIFFNLNEADYLRHKDPLFLATQYKLIMIERVLPFFLGSDQAGSNANITLRKEGFYHMKTPSCPFLVKTIYQSNKVYWYKYLMEKFPIINPSQKREKKIHCFDIKNKDMETIKQRVTIEALCLAIGIDVSQYSRTSKLNCPQPSHSNGDRIPSLVIYHETNSFYCFGCNKGGDIFAFYMFLHNCSFKEAISHIKFLFRIGD